MFRRPLFETDTSHPPLQKTSVVSFLYISNVVEFTIWVNINKCTKRRHIKTKRMCIRRLSFVSDTRKIRKSQIGKKGEEVLILKSKGSWNTLRRTGTCPSGSIDFLVNQKTENRLIPCQLCMSLTWRQRPLNGE